MLLTKYVVGANAKPPKNPSSPPKKGNVMATNMVNAANHQIKHMIRKIHTYQLPINNRDYMDGTLPT